VKGAIRLAIRQEGNMVNAYVAKADTMEGAFVIGSIALGVVQARRDLFDRFQQTMTAALQVLVEANTGLKVEGFDVQAAPEHEKAGHA